jgi:uncharacterized protein
MPETCLYFGEIMHHRFRPAAHRFVYRVFSILLDLDAVPALAARSRVFSHNRFNLFSFHDRDHGARDGSPVRPWVEGQLRAAGIRCDAAKIFVLCFPRLFGYVFNPLTIYWCYEAGGVLSAIVYEVKNTFGEQHAYALPARARGGAVRQWADKEFYVSPFLEMAARYDFRLRDPEQNLSIAIHESDAQGKLLVATHVARRQAWSDAALLRAFVMFPLMTLKIVAGIHWEALHLWRKGVTLVARRARDELRVPR